MAESLELGVQEAQQVERIVGKVPAVQAAGVLALQASSIVRVQKLHVKQPVVALKACAAVVDAAHAGSLEVDVHLPLSADASRRS